MGAGIRAYVVVQVTVHDPTRYEDYKKLVLPTLAALGGRFLVRGGATKVLEGSWNPQRLVILEFPSEERARAWWASADYAPAKALRQATASTEMLLVEGVPSSESPDKHQRNNRDRTED